MHASLREIWAQLLPSRQAPRSGWRSARTVLASVFSCPERPCVCRLSGISLWRAERSFTRRGLSSLAFCSECSGGKNAVPFTHFFFYNRLPQLRLTVALPEAAF